MTFHPTIIAAVAAGGALGAVARYAVSAAALRLAGPGFPWGTLAANVSGSFAMGVLIGVLAGLESIPEELRAFLTVGFLGAFTTFSTFSLDFVVLIERKAAPAAFAYAGASVLGAVAALFAGLVLARSLS
ncbi:MAG: fluoride efflux transporter CrcB [Pseudomonadota bacterium]